MAVVREDDTGPYIKVGGYIARPADGKTTRYMEGCRVGARHLGPGTTVGVEKLPTRGKWREYWQTHGSYIAGVR